MAEIGGLQLNLEPVDIKYLLEKIIRNLYLLMQEKELTLDWNAPEESVTTSGESIF